MKQATKAIRFIETLKIPEGPKAGKPLKLVPYQKEFIQGSYATGIDIGVMSIARGNAKSALSASIALGTLVGAIDDQPRREILLAARTRDQAKVLYTFCLGLARSLPDDMQRRINVRKGTLEIEYEAEDGPHTIRAIPADGRSILGTSPVLTVHDERGWWDAKGDELETALLSGLGKRGGRALIISTSAPTDNHPFSVWLDTPQANVYRQEHRADLSLPPDDVNAIMQANPGAKFGVGASLEWLQTQATIAAARGGRALSNFRLFHLNQRVADEDQDLLLRYDEWNACEVGPEKLPPRSGPCVIGLDLGGSRSMSAAAFYWPVTHRLEVLGTFPTIPTLADRGHNDAVGDRYAEMAARGELNQIGQAVVPVQEWIKMVVSRVKNENVVAVVTDRFRQAEMEEALHAAGLRLPVVWRGFGFKDGSADVNEFQKAVLDGKVKSLESLLLRSAFEGAVIIKDPAGNSKIAKNRSVSRIDAAVAAVLAVAEGQRRTTVGPAKRPSALWV